MRPLEAASLPDRWGRHDRRSPDHGCPSDNRLGRAAAGETKRERRYADGDATPSPAIWERAGDEVQGKQPN